MSDLETLLRRWGRFYGEPRPAEWDEDSSGDEAGQTIHVLDSAARSSGTSKATDMADQAKRARRRDTVKKAMKASLVLKGSFDKREYFEGHTCYGHASRGGPKPMYTDPLATWVDKTAIQLYTADMVRGVVLRIEYCTRGKHRDKLPVVQKIVNDCHMSLRKYRQHLDYARVWMDGALFVKKTA